MFNINKFLARTGHTHASLAEKLDCSSGLIGAYASKEGAAPSYEKCKQLLDLGMSLEEMFGQETAQNCIALVPTDKELKEEASSFKGKVAKALVELQDEGFFKLKVGT